MTRARFDWLAEIGGAAALAAGAGFAALKLAPTLGVGAAAASAAGATGGFALGLLAIRLVPATPAEHRLAEFAVPRSDELLLDTPLADAELLLDMPIEDAELLLDTPIEDDALLLDTPWRVEDEVLLLEEALRLPEPGSRVVQLFAVPPMPSPGQLKDRIDRHLAAAPRPQAPPPDAAQALYAALDELKRSLR